MGLGSADFRSRESLLKYSTSIRFEPRGLAAIAEVCRSGSVPEALVDSVSLGRHGHRQATPGARRGSHLWPYHADRPGALLDVDVGRRRVEPRGRLCQRTHDKSRC